MPRMYNAYPASRFNDLVCFSHLRWNFVFQRPQHLLTRAAASRRCFYIEEPLFGASEARMSSQECNGVLVLTPHLPDGWSPSVQTAALRGLMDAAFIEHEIDSATILYWTPMALPFTRHLKRRVTVYDCMDELSLFRGAPPALCLLERELFEIADVVFTGGQSLYEAKTRLHHNVHALPSSVDAAHFAKALQPQAEPTDQKVIPGPHVGFFGVIDERLDIELVDAVAELRPHIHWVLIGPVVKIADSSLPRRHNIHWLGSKSYDALPAYLAFWDVAILPFARNEATRFISPTKTPEYLAGGRPVVSTSIRDVVRPYGELGLVRIADTAADFVRAVDDALIEGPAARQHEVKAYLASTSWDRTWFEMHSEIEAVRKGISPPFLHSHRLARAEASGE
jgi:UDP-galactopyranose mutase